MATMAAPAVLTVSDLVKDYQALRPLRVRALTVARGDLVALAGFDAGAAEMFVHLATGAALPDAGDITLFGRSTRTVADAREWLQSLEGLGLVSDRAVLVPMLSVLQNVAMPLTLDVDPIDPAIRQAAEALAVEADLDRADWEAPLGQMDGERLFRVRLARALAPGPALVIAEHPSAALPRPSVARVARDLARIVRARGAALVAISADQEFTRALGGRTLVLNPATGELSPPGRLERWTARFARRDRGA
jgi:predicted ABC-type transport system involved in lysophospholipase L1 biosynthesis ATPase subunit